MTRLDKYVLFLAVSWATNLRAQTTLGLIEAMSDLLTAFLRSVPLSFSVIHSFTSASLPQGRLIDSGGDPQRPGPAAHGRQNQSQNLAKWHDEVTDWQPADVWASWTAGLDSVLDWWKSLTAHEEDVVFSKNYGRIIHCMYEKKCNTGNNKLVLWMKFLAKFR